MSRQALTDEILKKSDAFIKEKAPEIFRTQLNKRTHRYSVNKEAFRDQLSIQIDRIKEFAEIPESEIDTVLLSIAETFVKDLYKKLNRTNRSGFNKPVFRAGSSDTSFVCIITSNGDKDVFRLLGEIRAPLLKTVAKEIGEKIFGDFKNTEEYSSYASLSAKQQLILDKNRKREHEAQKRYTKRLAEYSQGLRKSQPTMGSFRVDKIRKKGLTMAGARKFDALSYYLEGYLQRPGISTERSGGISALGHEKEGGVAKVALHEILNDIVGYLESDDVVNKLNIKSKIVSQFFNKQVNSLRLTKEVELNLIIEGDVGEEATRANLATSNQEAREFREGVEKLKNALTDTLAKKIKWASIEGSTPFDKAIGSKLVRHVEKRFNKNITNIVYEPLNLDTSTVISELTIEGSKSIKNKVAPSAKQIKSRARKNVAKEVKQAPIKQNWSSLIAIINKKLPEQVANNMGAPGLVYRTGRFANSAEVVNIEQTKDGYPSVVFNYQRDPYNVFDRSLGRSPWNTPARDPRALVDKSVREIVQEMAIGRFYTRRA